MAHLSARGCTVVANFQEAPNDLLVFPSHTVPESVCMTNRTCEKQCYVTSEINLQKILKLSSLILSLSLSLLFSEIPDFFLAYYGGNFPLTTKDPCWNISMFSFLMY